MNNIFLLVCFMSILTLSIQSPYKKDFDYLMLRQIWPKTSCMYPAGHICTIDKDVNSWVIHGLWYLYNILLEL